MVKPRDREAIAALALGFTILTAARTGEVIGATWKAARLDHAGPPDEGQEGTSSASSCGLNRTLAHPRPSSQIGEEWCGPPGMSREGQSRP